MKLKYLSHLLLFSSLLVLILGLCINPDKAMSLGPNVKGNITTSAEIKKDDLYRKIQIYSDQQEIEPIDAKIDRVWKAIPGYNGLRINMKASYEKMKANGEFDKNKIVYEEIPPNIHLEDLESEPIYRGNPQKPMVAFLINVAWGNEYIPEILKVLNEHQIKATFFFDGSWVKKNPDLAKMIKEAGHEIGNHAYSHPDLKQRSVAQTKEELQKTNDVIKATLGITPIVVCSTKWKF